MSRVLVTGAGAVSLAIARRLLRQGLEVELWLHARDGEQLRRRARACGLGAFEAACAGISGGELARDDAFDGVARARVEHVVHAAAVTRFGVDRATAEAVNVLGTRRALRFARSCPRLRSFVLVSSVHAAGLRTGAVAEAALRGPARFANEYERSKALAEDEVTGSGVPWRIARLGTVIAADPSGRVTSENAAHVVLRLLRAGLLPLMPGDAACPVHLVTAAAAAEACAGLLRAPAGTCANVTAPAALAPSLGALLARGHARLSRDRAWRARRVPPPLLVDAGTFDLLVAGAAGLASPLVSGALRCLAPFARQLFAPKSPATACAEALAGGLLATDPLAVLDAVVDRLPSGPARSLVEIPA